MQHSHPLAIASWEATMRKAEYYRAQANFCVEMAGEIKRSDYRDLVAKHGTGVAGVGGFRTGI